MITKSKAAQKKGYVKVGKLRLKKETLKVLTGSEARKVRGGVLPATKSVCGVGCK